VSEEKPKPALGRMNRATFWLALGAVVALYAAIAFFGNRTVAVNEIVLIIACVPRLHDIGRSGWLVLGPIALELGAVALAFSALPTDVTGTIMGCVALVIIGLIVWLGCIPGNPAANRFGDPPPPGLSFGRPKKL